MSLSAARLLRSLARPTMAPRPLHALSPSRKYSSSNRPTDPAQGGYSDSNNDRFQYDMKAPLLDAGIANIFQVSDDMLSVAETLPTGFRLNSGRTVHGPLLIVNNEAFGLAIPPPTPDDKGRVANPLQILDPQALRVLDVVSPKPELLVVGGGKAVALLSKEAREYLTGIGIKVELASSRFAVGTFNTLCEEGRNAALLALPAAVV
ncbi:hypothetical protein GGI15_000742 [Coemansia interrupta]|uniref:NADH dehydrogenase [ubiquinone] 1 alpha subcomplex assembly factor 3 n=1 Tax=Coemansia interrupta TaxID=1126814 RepID=A0A9W8HMK0_9FUNG|nr:hypothetical protein GGI15_000742 [Coemansia interrupta]